MLTLEITVVFCSAIQTLNVYKLFPLLLLLHSRNVCEKTRAISGSVRPSSLSLSPLQTLSSSSSSTSDGSTGWTSSESMNMGPLGRMNSVGVEVELQETELQLPMDLSLAQTGRSSHQWRRRTIKTIAICGVYLCS